jgi:Ca2+-binding RTX toxin-like protein
MSNTTSSVIVTEIQVSETDPSKTIWGDVLANQVYFAIVRGTAADETFDAADLSASTLARMATNMRGVTVAMNGGNDTVIGSAYGDTITAGAGVNYVDGGANLGIQGVLPGGGARAVDMLDVYVADAAAAGAVAVIVLDAASGGADASAFASGFNFKVTNGTVETTYIKNIEQVNVRLASDRSFVKAFTTAVLVTDTILPPDQLATATYLAWAIGTEAGDSVDATSAVSAATLATMNAVGRGVYIDAGAGNDTLTGSAYGDYLIGGAGINYVDGGANSGTTPSGGRAEDILQVTVASNPAAAAVQVVALAGSVNAADISAAQAGYSHKVVAAGETSYVKGIERVSIFVSDGVNWWHSRDIPLAVLVSEANLATPNIGDYSVVAWVNGTAGADVIDLGGATSLLSMSLANYMAGSKQGVWVAGGGGDDVITGTAYTDIFINGSGNARIDGGSNRDTFEITVATQAAMDGVVVSVSDDPVYTWMVTYGAGSTQKDYLKNVEGVLVSTATSARFIGLSIGVWEANDLLDVATRMHLASATGTPQADSFDAAVDVSAATRALMDTYGRGVFVDTGAGNDTIKGSGYGDDIYAGAGVNHVDGGANAGLTVAGVKAHDVLRVTVPDQAAADAVQVVVLAPNTGSAQDIAEFNAGYTHKVISAGATDYIRNIERISIETPNSNGRAVSLGVDVNEANLAWPDLASFAQVAWITGTSGADAINAADGSLLSTPLAAQMASAKQGVYVDGGAGDDVITGSPFSDTFLNGAGNSKIDGGANAAQSGRDARDVFQIVVADQAALDAVSVAPSENAAYTWMVTYGAGSTQKDYLKNVEAISVSIQNGGAARSLLLAVEITEIPASQISPYIALVHGSVGADTFNAATDLSAAMLASMVTHRRGIHIDSGSGDDNLTGTPFGDHFLAGAGNDYIDGGLNGGVDPGNRTEDLLELRVASAAAAAAVQLTDLSNGGSAADIAAFARGFTHKVVQPAAGGETDYIKGIEHVLIQVSDGVNSLPGGRDIMLTFALTEVSGSGYRADERHFAQANGTEFADKFDPLTEISAATRALMDTYQRGIVVYGWGGSDIITGSPYGDELTGGDGIDYIDGGANSGTQLGGSAPAQDVLRLNVGNMDDMDAAAVTRLAGGGSAADTAAFNSGYTHKLSVGTMVTDYFKNIELVAIEMIASGGVVYARFIAVTPATSPSGMTAPYGMSFQSSFAPSDTAFDASTTAPRGGASTGVDPLAHHEVDYFTEMDYMVTLVGFPLQG